MKLRYDYFSNRFMVEMLFVFSILMLMSKKMMDELHIIFGNKSIVSSTVLYIFIIVLFLWLVLIRFINQQSVNGNYAFILFLFLLGVLISVAFSPSGLSLLIELRNLLFAYVGVLLLCVVNMLDMRLKYKKEARVLIIIFTLCQSLLGIYQHVARSPIIPVVDSTGKSIVNTIYYLNGISSKNPYFLDLGAEVRAFGMTDSGLTLGLFAFLGILLVSQLKNKFLSYLLTAIYLLAIYYSITRVVWLIVILYFITLFLDRLELTRLLPFMKTGWFTVGITLQGLLLFSAGTVYIISIFSEFDTLLSRFEGLVYFMKNLSFNPITIIFGQNFSSRLVYFNQVTRYSLDNEVFKIFADIGLLGVGIIFALYKKMLGYFNGRYLLFLSMFTMFGIGNVVNYFYIPLLVLSVMLLDTNKSEVYDVN
ncbi:hypothetical protein ACQRD4_01090 [Streptococcus hyointestinalis]|uniref:hypothetical protein n=1 Tax=Streptococcus hyointestinalis TaxID=1337 RepID=UPI003CFDB683